MVIKFIITFLATCSLLLAPDHCPLTTPNYQLVRMQGRALERGIGDPPTLRFNPEAGTATGKGFCNQYTFLYSLGKNDPQRQRRTIRLTPWGCGNIECPEGNMNREKRYLSLLERATSLSVTSTTLTLYQRDKEVLYFELSETTPALP